jgi:type IV secretory pathway TraG/TraD family ATPase VirD4
MTWSGMADKFLFNPFNRLFCGGKCSFSPEMTIFDGKLIICDFPLLEYGHETGKLINVILKLIFQRAWLRRKISESPNPIFCWQDEFQYFVTRRDNFFQQTCRGSRVAVVCLTQNILNLSEELGEQQPGSKTKSFLGNLSTKIFHQQNETETCNFAADQIGKHYVFVPNFNAGSSGAENAHTGFGGSKQLVHIIEPLEFTRLVKPDGQNFYAQAIVYQSGKTFNATKTQANPEGTNYISTFFSR